MYKTCFIFICVQSDLQFQNKHFLLYNESNEEGILEFKIWNINILNIYIINNHQCWIGILEQSYKQLGWVLCIQWKVHFNSNRENYAILGVFVLKIQYFTIYNNIHIKRYYAILDVYVLKKNTIF